MDLAHYLRIQARANRLANHRLHGAMAALTHEDFHAPRISFFPTLAKTLNHILTVDLYHIGALYGEAGLRAGYHAFVPADTVAALAPRQAASDERLIAWPRWCTWWFSRCASTWPARSRWAGLKARSTACGPDGRWSGAAARAFEIGRAAWGWWQAGAPGTLRA